MRTVKERFEEKVHPIPQTGCWEWAGNIDPSHGYGRYNQKYAHRLSYEIYVGEIPDGMFVCHKCDNPSCVNPDHLFIGTCLDNVRDCISKGRFHQNPPPPYELRYRLYTDDQVRMFREAYNKGDRSIKELSDHFGVKYITFYNIVKGTTYIHVV